MGCIEHTQKGNHFGYGSSRLNGQRGTMHRVEYCKAHDITLGSIKGLVVRHTCDNARCINPEHLVIGTQQDNMVDRCARQRTNKGEDRPQSILTDAQVRFIREHYVRYSKTWGTVAIARMLGVNYRTVQSVTKGTAWTHVV